MPNPKLETYKNKATNTVYDLTDADAQSKLTAILDGTDIDSFGDVESALAGKMQNYYLEDNIDTITDLETGHTSLHTKTTDVISAGVATIPTSRGVDGAFSDIVISEFTALDNYAVGDYVKHEGKVYKCTTAHSAGVWVAGDFTQVKVLNEVKNKADRDAAFPRDEQAILGAKNILPNKLLTLTSLKAINTSGNWSNNVYTLNSVTFTCIEENGYVVRIDVDGTATGGNAQFLINNRNSGNFVIPKGSWIGNGCPEGGSDNGYHMRYIETVSGSALEHKDYGSGVAFTVESANNCGVTIYVKQNGSASNKSFYPMLRVGTDPDSTFVQPAMTNRELTEKVQGIINAATNAADFAAFKTAIGNL